MPTMGMLERYVLKRTMSALVAALAVLGAMVMLIAFVVVTVNFLVDMAYMALDPRIKFGE